MHRIQLRANIDAYWYVQKSAKSLCWCVLVRKRISGSPGLLIVGTQKIRPGLVLRELVGIEVSYRLVLSKLVGIKVSYELIGVPVNFLMGKLLAGFLRTGTQKIGA